MKVNYVKYICQQCDAEDTLKLFEGERAAPVLNCWKCHSGFNMEVPNQLMERKGMFPEQKKS